MSSSDSSQSRESKQEKEAAHVSESPDSQAPVREELVMEEGEEEEMGECLFCLFMKAGGCRDEFVNWEKCVEEAEKNEEDENHVVGRCAEISFTLKECMEAHRDYYAPLFLAVEEKEAMIMKEFEREGKEGVEATAANDQTEKGKGSDGSAAIH